MTIRRVIFGFIAAIVVLSSCEKSNQFTISGKITHGEGQTLYLEELLVSSLKPVDEVKLDKNGEFEFKSEASIPTFYLLKISDQKMITLLVDSLENVVVEADIANFSRSYHVDGSEGSKLIKVLKDNLDKTEQKLDSLVALNNLYKGNPDYEMLKTKWDEEYSRIIREQAKFSSEFVTSHPFSMASVYALYQKYQDNSYVIQDLQAMRTAASALNSIYPESKHVQALYQNALRILQQERSERMQQFIEEQGVNSPDILLPDQDGGEIALSSLRGKFVLLQFWDAEDRGSRIMNPVLAELYNKYKRKGFEIYQVNVGTNRIEWVDAIDKDKLIWTNVGDMKGSNGAVIAYNVKQVPYNYLLDKEGNILGKALKGPALDKALARILE